MINKEIIVKDGAIYKDFIDRNIPQYSNNQVCVSVLIPAGVFVGNEDYSVILAVGYRQQTTSPTTTLNTLVMTASKSITIDGVLYVKYSAILSYYYTENIGQLLLSPYIRKIIHTQGDYNEETQEYEDVALLSLQNGYTHTQLNVIKSVLPQYDASLENPQVVDTLNGKIEEKKIYTFIDTDSASLGEHYYSLVNGYDPNADQFNGCLVMSVYDGETRQYIPYLNDSDVELLEITKDGVFYNISGVDYSNPTYTYVRKQISYSYDEIEGIKTNLQNQINDKVDKTQKVNGHALSGDIDITKGDVGLGNVANMNYESTPTASGESLYITSKGVYDALQTIYATLTSDYATKTTTDGLNTRLESVEAIIGSDDGDADSVINTLKEVIVVLNGLGEGANLLDLINAKANQSDLTALSGVVNAMGLKVDVLYDANANAYMEIKAQSGTIDILTTDWVANSDDYASDYPYKYTLTNGYLVGASNVIVVFSVDSDTSLLSTSVAIDDVNGSITIYATDTPTETISIEKVAVFNNVNAYINYSQTIVSQVNSNTDAISDINNVKLPLHELKQEDLGTNKGTKSQYISSGFWTQRAKRLNYGETKIEQSYNEICLSYKTNDNFDAKILVKEEAGYSGLIKLQTYTHALQLDHNGLTLDGVAVGGGGHKVIKCFNQAIEQYTINGNPVGGVWCITATAIGYGVAIDTATGNTPTSFDKGDIVLGYSQVEHGTYGDPDFYTEDILNQILVVNEQIQNGDVLLQFQNLAQYSESRMLTTATTPTDTAGVLTLSASDVNEGGGKVGDYISYISSGSISALYKITAVNYVNDAFVYTIDKTADIGGGKQLYRNRASLSNVYCMVNGEYKIFALTLDIICDTQITTKAELITFINGLSTPFDIFGVATSGSYSSYPFYIETIEKATTLNKLKIVCQGMQAGNNVHETYDDMNINDANLNHISSSAL